MNKLNMESLLKKHLIALLFTALSCSTAFAQGDHTDWVDPDRLVRGEKDIYVEGNERRGSIKVVRFTIPENHLLLKIQINVNSKAPFGNDTFQIDSMAGYRISRLDKHFEYRSLGMPSTIFEIEAWARKSGTWFAPAPTHVDLRVVYYYYVLDEIGQDEFNQAVEHTFQNIHTTPVHQSIKDIFLMRERKDYDRRFLVEEILLNEDSACSWGSTSNCKDCVMKRTLHDNRRNYRYFYNSKATDGICF